MLSLWEISHRLAGFEPDVTDEESLPEAVKENIRELLVCLQQTLNLYDESGNEQLERLPLIAYIPVLWKYLNLDSIPNQNMERAKELALKREYPKQEIDSFYIRKDEFEYYRNKMSMPLPSFWYGDDEIEYHEIKIRKRIDRTSTDDEDVYDYIDRIQSQAQASGNTVSEGARKAAIERHKPRNEIKDRFIAYYHESNDWRSKTEAARRFFASLDENEQRTLCNDRTEAKAVRTLLSHLKINQKHQ